MQNSIDVRNIGDYERFLRIRALPSYQFHGSFAEYPDEYAALIGAPVRVASGGTGYVPRPFLFDFQSDIVSLAVRKRRFCVFADCGLGKTMMLLEFARNAMDRLPKDRAVLIVSPLMVVEQTMDEATRFYGDELGLEQVRSADLGAWLQSGGRFGITNYEALTNHVERGRLGCLIVDESSMLKSHYGKWGTEIVRLGRGVEWKLALTGTPAPNDRIEYANHAVLMDVFPTVNSFLARYFLNRGQTDNRWEIKPHAVEPFYRDLSHWCVFVSDPAVYGWAGCGAPPPIHVHIHDVPLTDQQRTIASEITGELFTTSLGGITTRSRMAGLAKGWHDGEKIETRKIDYIRDLVATWPTESTIIWCLYNREQDAICKAFPEAGNITGDTPYEDRQRIIGDFKAGRLRLLVTKPKILGFGLNLQVATRQVFSGLQDSYESFYQAVKRSNRYGSSQPLNVHIPVTELERPMIQTVLAKAKRVHDDTQIQERLFRDNRIALVNS